MSVSPDAESFARIVPAHAAAMLRLAAAYLGPADAEDAVQEAALHAWQGWPALRNREAVRPWLLQITVNVCRGWRRGLKGQQQSRALSLPEDGEQLPAPLDLDPGTSDHTGALDLRAAINRLPDALRGVVILRFYGGLDATEIGAALGIPAGTVRSRLHRALSLVRDQLAPPDTPPGLAPGASLTREERAE